MMDLDLLSDFVSPPTIQTNQAEAESSNDYFVQHFWGEKHHGFDVLYHNMKHGQLSIKSLQDFIRESAISEDLCAKHLTKLAKLTSNFSPLGTFAPMFEALKTVAEKLSSCRMDIFHKLHEQVKDLTKYLEEQKTKHKQVKEEMSSTANVLQQLQATAAAVQKNKEKYHQFCIETEKLKRVSAPTKDIEKVEAKLKKAADEYRNIVDKHGGLRTDYEQKMSDSAKKFQEIESAHLQHMRSVLESYILTFENGNVLTGQVHQEFRRQIDEKTIESLIKQYSESKGTGTTKPEPLKFEEFDAEFAHIEVSHVDGVSSDSRSSRSPPPTSRINLNLPFLRRKGKKSAKSGSSIKETNSNGSPDQEATPNVDEEGYTIRPEISQDIESNRKRTSSMSSGSDWDDDLTRKIHVKINPKEPGTSNPENNLDKLNAITKSLVLNPPGEKKAAVHNGEAKSDPQPITNGEKASTDQILDLFANKTPIQSSVGKEVPTVDDIFGEQSTPPPSSALPQSSSNLSLNNLFVMPSSKEAENESTTETKSSTSDLVSSSASSTSHSIDFSFPDTKHNGSRQGSFTGLTTPDGVSTPSSLTAPSLENFASSRGPSPLPVAHGDPIPIAVAFTETVNAMFKGGTDSCFVKVSGQMQLSFPAGIVRTFASNPYPRQLSFLIKGISNLESMSPSQSFISVDALQSTPQQRSFAFDSTSLCAHIKKMADANPSAMYYNIPVLSYQVDSQSGHSIAPLLVTSSLKCEANATEITINYKYNSTAIPPLTNVMVSVPVNGQVQNVQSAPEASWNAAQNRLLWTLPSPISRSSPTGTLHSKLSLTSTPSSVSKVAFKFNAEGSTVSGTDFALLGSGYRLSLVKKRFTAGTYLCIAS